VLRAIDAAVAGVVGVRVETRRLLLAQAWRPDAASAPLVGALRRNAEAVFGETVATGGTPLYTDVRLYAAADVAAAIYGAGPRTVLESNAKRADEHLDLADLRGATKVVGRTLLDLLREPSLG
jgi:succinyl-diaminopimelate desuccinylase